MVVETAQRDSLLMMGTKVSREAMGSVELQERARAWVEAGALEGAFWPLWGIRERERVG